MDGTLVDSEKLWDIPLYELAEKLGGRLSANTRESLIGSSMSNTVAVMYSEVGIVASADDKQWAAEWISARIAELFTDELPLRPGALDALRAVRDAGIPAALVTSTDRALTELALHTIGRDFFAVTVCGDEVGGRNKPHPEPYARAARLLGVPARRCVAIEDSQAGATSAAAAGCTVLVIPNDMPVVLGERMVRRDSLVGVDAELLAGLFDVT
ncbi:MAG: HAD family phosphatase [Sciscionella sp.]|nr:HAD family phosphatase [Sciscionella sp.]